MFLLGGCGCMVVDVFVLFDLNCWGIGVLVELMVGRDIFKVVVGYVYWFW